MAAESHVVLPVDRVTARKRAIEVHQIVRLLVLAQVVLHVGNTQRRIPLVIHWQAYAQCGHVVDVVLVHRGQEEVGVLGGTAGTPALQHYFGTADVAAQGDGVRAVVVTTGERGGTLGGEAIGLQPRGAERSGHRFTRQRALDVCFARTPTAGAEAYFEQVVFRATGEDLHHTTDGVAAVKRRQRALHYLDALQQGGGQVLQRSTADGAGVEAHAIDQYQRMVAVGAANEHGGVLANAAAAAEFQAGVEAQQVRKFGAGGAGQFFAREYGDAGVDIDEFFRGAGGGDEEFVCGSGRRSGGQRQGRKNDAENSANGNRQRVTGHFFLYAMPCSPAGHGLKTRSAMRRAGGR